MTPDQLESALAEVNAKYAQELLDFVQSRWTGWSYEGRPADEPRGVSQKAFFTESDGSGFFLGNSARDEDGDFYAGEVVRKAGAIPEIDQLWDTWEQTELDNWQEEVVQTVLKLFEV